MSLPILIYDERRLTPALGYVFPAYWVRPHESLLCMLWKFALQNAIPGHDLASQIARVKIDPYEGVAARKEYVNTQRLARLLGISHRAVSAGLLHSIHAAPHLRYCTGCLSRAYHCIVHQLTWLTHCPMHPHHLLQSCCPSCGEQLSYRFSARVFDAPFRCANCRKPLTNSRLQPTRVSLSQQRIVLLIRLRHRYAVW